MDASEQKETADFQTEYEEWTPRSLADPRIAKLPQFFDGLEEIVATEGPVHAYRAYQIYARAAGLGKIAAATKARFDFALTRALDERRFATEDAYPNDGETSVSDLFICAPDQPHVRVRTLGTRTIDQVPPSELAEVMLEVRASDELLGKDDIYRLVMARYGLQKITALARRTLDHVLATYF